MRTVYFHEDDYCQCEVLPLTAKAYCLHEMGEINDFAEEHREGSFYTDIYLREDSPHTLRELNLRSEQVAAALDFLPAFDLVETGYSSYREECKSTCARGFSDELAVFWDTDEEGFVKALWLVIRVKAESADTARRIYTALGSLAPLLLADWNWTACVDLTDFTAIENYVQEHLHTEDNSVNREELLKQINEWHETDGHQKIIDAIEALPQEEWGYELTGFLARAYNNLAMNDKVPPEVQHERLEKAVALLESIREEGQDDDRWHFRLGYALYYLDRPEEALTCFRRVRELDPEDQDALQFIQWCENTLEVKTGTDSEEPSFYVTLNLNARFQPMHRHELEDALDDFMSRSDIGFVDGGGTLMSPSGEVKSCDIEIALNDGSEETIAELEAIIDILGVPKGSKLLWTAEDGEEMERPAGRLEGMAIYLNGSELPPEVYESCDINHVIEQLSSRIEGIGQLYSWWEGPETTALYFYGQSYEKMSAAVQDFIAEYPLCQKCVMEKIA